jgi:capsular polysaccharide biosynthesis protein
MWHNREPFSAHPDIQETWARLTAGLLAGEPPAAHERIFVSRGDTLHHRRGCTNQEQVERLFAERGYHVLYPEKHSLREQAAIFAGARVVAGFAGSAMFNMMHTRRLEAVVVLSHNAYPHLNEHLFARLRGAALHHFWSPSHETAELTPLAQAPWSFDFAHRGPQLERLLAEL